MEGFKEALNDLRLGKVIAYPSEGVWGLGCDPRNKEAVLKLLNLKKRPMDKGLILVASNIRQMETYIDLKKYKKKLMTKWPGPHTWVVPTKTAPKWIRGEFTSVALRLTEHPVLKLICEDFQGAIVSSSANLQGERPSSTKEEVKRIFKDVSIIGGELGSLRKGTPIQDIQTEKWIRK